MMVSDSPLIVKQQGPDSYTLTMISSGGSAFKILKAQPKLVAESMSHAEDLVLSNAHRVTLSDFDNVGIDGILQSEKRENARRNKYAAPNILLMHPECVSSVPLEPADPELLGRWKKEGQIMNMWVYSCEHIPVNHVYLVTNLGSITAPAFVIEIEGQLWLSDLWVDGDNRATKYITCLEFA